jgi:hypothetical protein
MKHTFLKFGKIAIGVVLSSFLVFSTTTVSAKANKKQAESSVSISPVVKFAGTDSEGASFISVSFESPAPVKFEVIITDANGNEFFSREFESARFLKTFKLVNTADGFSTMDLTLSIRMSDTGKAQEFKINSTIEQVPSVSITKL